MDKHILLRAASAVALVAAMGTAAVSQTGSPGGGSPAQGQQQRMPDNMPGSSGQREEGTRPAERAQEKAAPKSQVQGERDTPKASERAQEKASPKSKVQGQSDTPKASDRAEEKASPKSKVQGQSDTPKSSDRAEEKASPKSSVGQRKGDDDNRRSASDRDKDGKDAQRQSRDRSKDDSKGMTDRGQKDGDRTRQGQADSDRGERVQLSQQQRTQVHERLKKSGRANRVTNVNFDIRIGASVPRSVTLAALPPDIIEIVPQYRGYRYVYVGETILIVDPGTYVVVAVLGDEPRAARRGGRITISSEDRVFIRRHVDLGATVRLGIGGISIGMTLPTNVELRPLPATVWQRVPDLRDHRYFVYEDEIVIVEPDSREVVLVIDN